MIKLNNKYKIKEIIQQPEEHLLGTDYQIKTLIIEIKLEDGISKKLRINIPKEINIKEDRLINQLRIEDNNIYSLEQKNLLISKLKNILNEEKHKIRMILKGVGYNIKKNNNELEINIGYKNTIKVSIPADIKIELKSDTEIIGESWNKEKLSQWMSKIKQLKPSYKDKYKQKGFSNIEYLS